MGLSAGARLGPYEIQAPLGAGGMGEVYRARDTRLGRDVAIKILPEVFTSDPERLARFEREARMLAALNHPHIGAIYGVEDAETVHALVLELVEGDTLGERLRRGPLRLTDALAIARQIAEALESAHEQGIIHRDLKPANVKITHDGTVKVLDFGLAKAAPKGGVEFDFEQSPTITVDATFAGAILGTAAYMSPEQARGKAVDKQTDIWAFGCVLYEMLAGYRAFSGDTASDTIAAILEREPRWERVPRDTTASTRVLLRRCLEKDPKHQLQNIGDAQIELEDILSGSERDRVIEDEPIVITRRAAISALAGVAVGAASMGIFAISRNRGAVPRTLTRFRIPLPEGTIAPVSFNKRVAISPEGTHIAFNVISGGVTNYLPIGGDKFYLHSLRELEPKPVSFDAGAPFFSSDGKWIGFMGTAGGRPVLRKMALGGGPPGDVCGRGYVGATWAADDMIYFVSEVPGGVGARRGGRRRAEGGCQDRPCERRASAQVPLRVARSQSDPAHRGHSRHRNVRRCPYRSPQYRDRADKDACGRRHSPALFALWPSSLRA